MTLSSRIRQRSGQFQTIQGSTGTSWDMVLFATCSVSGQCAVFSRSTADYSQLCCRAPTPAAPQRKTNCGSRLNVKADEVKHGPAQLEPLAEWVRGIGTAEKLGLLVQQSIGRLFVETFTATEESVAAA